MPKEIRFAELVKKCGKPETVTLWTKPGENPPFRRAIRENRVLTLIQKPTGAQKDFGIIGFLQEPFTLFLVFPKRLPRTDARVIGIKYDLIAQPAVKPSLEKPDAKRKNESKKAAPATAPKEKPVPLKKFRITILRTATQEIKLNLNAANIYEAEAAALRKIKSQKFEPRDVQEEIKGISEI